MLQVFLCPLHYNLIDGLPALAGKTGIVKNTVSFLIPSIGCSVSNWFEKPAFCWDNNLSF
jgi:hypothetical protein